MSTTELHTPIATIARLRGSRAAEVAAQANQFVLATEWADAHPDNSARAGVGACSHGRPSSGGPDSPWDAAASFAAALGHTKAGSVALDRLVDETLLRLYREQREADRPAGTVDVTIDITGPPRERPTAGGCRRSHAPPGRSG